LISASAVPSAGGVMNLAAGASGPRQARRMLARQTNRKARGAVFLNTIVS
jgi:hypothetical protein